jgi:hypothetical protein
MGDLPLTSNIVGSAPCTTSNSTCKAWPALVAMCNGVLPFSWKENHLIQMKKFLPKNIE